VGLTDDLDRIADAALGHAGEHEALAAVIPAEPDADARVYLCAFAAGEARSWLAFDADAVPMTNRELIRDAVSIAALCELAEESAGGGKLDELRGRLNEVARVEGSEVTADADAALAELEQTLEPPPRVASAGYLDRIGAATRRLERALGEVGTSPFAEAMKAGTVAVEGLSAEVEDAYKLPLT
jgi:hypothetical protein